MSEPTRIGAVLPPVMSRIRRRCEQNPDNKDFSEATRKKPNKTVSGSIFVKSEVALSA